MTLLPPDYKLPINLLAASFNHTSATYKFYWFIALLDEVEKGNITINKQHLFAGMLANAWYTVNYFHISFGQQDQLQRAIEAAMSIEHLAIDERKPFIYERLLNSEQPATKKILRYFDGEVPYRFLSPWFNTMKGNKREIYQLSQSFANNCLYAVDDNEVRINPNWYPYLLQHTGILKSFCYWHLALYLQKHNPNVPDIPNKLIKPAQRNSLLKQRKEFWDVVIGHHGPLSCIYTNRSLSGKDYAVEHFIPYAFVSHDLVWNLIPADRSFNSSKRDKLPPLEKYFEPYFQLQKTALFTLLELAPKNKLLEDYLSILPDLHSLNDLGEAGLRDRFRENIQPLVTIAGNNGFEFMG